MQFYNAYQKMSGSRQVSMSGALPIPIQAFESYCSLYKIHDVEIIETLHDRVMFLDGVFLEHIAKQQAKTKE